MIFIIFVIVTITDIFSSRFQNQYHDIKISELRFIVRTDLLISELV